MIAIITVIAKKTAANNLVVLLKNSSIPFFLPKKVSAPPAIDPDRPAEVPDCSNTVAIIAKAITTCTIVKAKSKISPPKLKSNIQSNFNIQFNIKCKIIQYFFAIVIKIIIQRKIIQ